MKFTKTEPNEVFDAFRCISTNGKWEAGCRRMLFGIRVGLSRIGDCCYTLDYCSGDDPAFTLQLMATLIQILQQYSEDITPVQIQRDFPRYEVKPINRDPHCWQRLQEMAQSMESERCRHCFKSVDGYLEEDEVRWFCPHCGEENLN